MGEPLTADLERMLGPDHHDTLNSRNSLAAAYQAAGRPADAIALFEQTLVIRERFLGPEHPDTLTTQNNLAFGYQAAGRAGEARLLFELTLAARERLLGPGHPSTLISRGNLAAAYRDEGRADDALRLFEQTLKGREAVLGAEHPDTVTSRVNLAAAYREAGRVNRRDPAGRADPGDPGAAARPRPPEHPGRTEQPGRRLPGDAAGSRRRSRCSSRPWRIASGCSAPTIPGRCACGKAWPARGRARAAPGRTERGGPSPHARTAANRSAARSSWARICSLARASSGVSGSAMSSRRTGTRGAYFPASLRSRGPVLWIRPTPLSVKSEALMTRAHGSPRRLWATCSRYCSCGSRPGAYGGVGHRADQFGHPRTELRRQHPERGLLAAAAGQLGGVVLHRVVQQGGAGHVGVAHAVVRHDPDRHPQQVVDVRLAFPAVGGVQPARQVEGAVEAAPVRLGPRPDVGREPCPQALLAVRRGDRVQRHGRHELPLATVHALQVIRPGRPAGRAGAAGGG